MKDLDSINGSRPRIYRVDSTTRRVLIGFGIVLVSFAVLMTFLHIAKGMRTARTMAGDLVTDIIFAAFALWISSSATRRVILGENWIEVIGWFAKRKFLREEIRGYRLGRLSWQAGSGSYYIIVPLNEHSRELKLPPFLHYDQFFFAWMKASPHLKSRST